MLRWGIIGCGDIAVKRVISALQSAQGSSLVAISRQNPRLLDECAKKFGIPFPEKRWEDLVSRDDVDAVYIASPVYLHAEQSLAAIHSGKHVLCEKPMAMDRHEAARMLNAAREDEVALGVAYYRRFYPIVKRIKAILQSGELGHAVYIRSDNFEPINPMPNQPRYWLMQPEKSGGGPMMDMGCHRIEAFTHLLGSVRQAKGTLFNSRYKRQVEDTAIATFEFESGAAGVLASSHAPGIPTDTLDIFCTDGSLHVPVLNGTELRIVNNREPGRPTVERFEALPNVHLPLVEDFIQAVSEQRQPGVDGAAGLEVTRLLDMIYGRP
jgi:predicted dehydrogenase